jgi:hypothetical protein
MDPYSGGRMTVGREVSTAKEVLEGWIWVTQRRDYRRTFLAETLRWNEFYYSEKGFWRYPLLCVWALGPAELHRKRFLGGGFGRDWKFFPKDFFDWSVTLKQEIFDWRGILKVPPFLCLVFWLCFGCAVTQAGEGGFRLRFTPIFGVGLSEKTSIFEWPYR